MKLREKPYILLPLGILNLTMHLPVFLFTSLWSVLLIGWIGPDALQSAGGLYAGLFPLFIPPVTCAVGILLPSLNRLRGKPSRLCFIFSLIGLALYAAMMAGAYWLGAHF